MIPPSVARKMQQQQQQQQKALSMKAKIDLS
jgi:hypothetical protein